MKKYVIGGIFVSRTITGVARYSWEIMAELDKQLSGCNDICVELLIPKGVKINQQYENIKIVQYGKNIKFFWYNVTLPLYLVRNNAKGIHFAVNVPWLKPDLVCIHDVNSIAHPQYFSKYHVFKTKLEKRIAVKRGKVFTVSNFSAGEIEKYIGGDKENYDVIPNAWQHLERVAVTGKVEEKFPFRHGEYYFSISSIAPTKNFKWVLEAAKQNPDDTFVIAGGTDPKSFGVDGLDENVKNVKYLGRVSDEEMKMLMSGCKAFVFPSFYEGFGIPPLEAFACGAPKVIVSDIPVMHEVCEDAACYIDPYEYENINMNKIMEQKTSNPQKILDKYSWEKSAGLLLDMLRRQ